MKTSRWIVSLALTALVASPAAWAQQGQQQPGMQQQQQQGRQSAQIQQPVRAEDLQGKTLKGQQGEDLGEIESVLADQQSGNSYAVVSGEQDKMYPIPVNAIQRGQQQDEFRVNISKDQLANAPSYQKDSPPILSDPQWQQNVHSYYGVQPVQAGQQQPGMQQQPRGYQMRYPQQQQPGMQQQQTRAVQPGQEQVGQQATPIRIEEELIGDTVVGRQGGDLGTVTEIISGHDGQIRHLIISRGGILGIGDERIPIPWQIVSPGTQEDRLVAGIDEQMLENAPRFRDDDRPNFEDPQWEREVYSYYGVQPDQAVQQQQPGMQQQPQQRTQMQQQPGEQQRGQQQQPGMQQQQQQGQQSAQIQQPVRAEDLQGKTLKGQQGEDLGEIESVLADPQSGNSYIVLSGEQDKMYPIPVNAIQRGQQQDEFRVNISKDQLANAPSYQKDSPPNLTDPQWQQNVHSYYGVKPPSQ